MYTTQRVTQVRHFVYWKKQHLFLLNKQYILSIIKSLWWFNILWSHQYTIVSPLNLALIYMENFHVNFTSRISTKIHVNFTHENHVKLLSREFHMRHNWLCRWNITRSFCCLWNTAFKKSLHVQQQMIFLYDMKIPFLQLKFICLL